MSKPRRFGLVLLGMVGAVGLGVAAALASGRAEATEPLPSDWTRVDTQRQWLSATVMVLDWGTTRNMSKRYHEGYYESWGRQFLGPFPSTGRVDRYFLLLTPMNAAVAYVLPAEYGSLRPSSLWPVGAGLVYGAVVVHYGRIGLRAGALKPVVAICTAALLWSLAVEERKASVEFAVSQGAHTSTPLLAWKYRF